METFRTPLAQSSCLESLRGESGLINLQPPGPLSLLILPTSNGNVPAHKPARNPITPNRLPVF